MSSIKDSIEHTRVKQGVTVSVSSYSHTLNVLMDEIKIRFADEDDEIVDILIEALNTNLPDNVWFGREYEGGDLGYWSIAID